ncbi:hypothetical protein QAD02_022671 [Eretmocerus hayati]|uniref:Uncharacterized protein n=1 Tax=Eretmocerus hayati TaxID=131215 RepID=A0ACC2PX03_9HYME|nr:hypothetical protein QAD02_022671 [Eretmocerus hayati]
MVNPWVSCGRVYSKIKWYNPKLCSSSDEGSPVSEWNGATHLTTPESLPGIFSSLSDDRRPLLSNFEGENPLNVNQFHKQKNLTQDQLWVGVNTGTHIEKREYMDIIKSEPEHASLETDQVERHEDSSPEITEVGRKERYPCTNDFCRRVYSSIGSLYYHMKYECGKKKRFKCGHCNFRSTRSGSHGVGVISEHISYTVPTFRPHQIFSAPDEFGEDPVDGADGLSFYRVEFSPTRLHQESEGSQSEFNLDSITNWRQSRRPINDPLSSTRFSNRLRKPSVGNRRNRSRTETVLRQENFQTQKEPVEEDVNVVARVVNGEQFYLCPNKGCGRSYKNRVTLNDHFKHECGPYEVSIPEYLPVSIPQRMILIQNLEEEDPLNGDELNLQNKAIAEKSSYGSGQPQPKKLVDQYESSEPSYDFLGLRTVKTHYHEAMVGEEDNSASRTEKSRKVRDRRNSAEGKSRRESYGIYACPNRGCDRIYTSKDSWYSHVHRECGKNPRFKCGYCDFMCQRAYDVRRHSTKKHPGCDYSILDTYNGNKTY